MKLRKLERKDLLLMMEWMQDVSITQNFHVNFAEFSEEDALRFIQNSYTIKSRNYAIVNSEDTYLGTISLKNIGRIPNTAELSIVLRKIAMGTGVACQSILAILDIAFKELKLNKVYLNVLKSNNRAKKLYEKIGFKTEVEYEIFQPEEDNLGDLDYYSISYVDLKPRSYEVIKFEQMGDDRGRLVVVEGKRTIPFDIKRVFYIYGSDETAIRGCHANRMSEFVLVNVSGSSKVLIDNGYEKHTVELNEPHMGVYIPRMNWKEMFDFSEDSVLLVLASEHFILDEYIKDYHEYLRDVRGEENE